MRIPLRSFFLLLGLLTPVLAIPNMLLARDPLQPNVVYIISDDQTYTDFGFMGNDLVETPHLDKLAAQSVVYPNGYVPASVCRPSLVTMLTGLYPHQHGVYFNHPPPGFSKLTKSPEIGKERYDALREEAAKQILDQPSLPRLLAADGYRSLQTGKYWEGHFSNAGFTEGMTLAEPSGGVYGDKELASGAIVAHGNGDAGLAIGRETIQPITDFLDDCVKSSSPFLVWYAPFLPHTPHNSPERYFEIYRNKPGVAEKDVAYFAAISQFDDTVGQLIADVESRGLAKKTLFVFVVDNGWQADPDGPSGHTKNSKRAPFDYGLRTPIMLRWDGVIEPETHEGLVNSIDLLPTILSACHLEIPDVLPGIDLMPSAKGEQTLDPDRAIFGDVYPGDAVSLGKPEENIAYRWVRQGNYKYIHPHAPDGGKPWGSYLSKPALYDVVKDPDESNNLLGDGEYAEIAASLKRQLDDWWDPEG